MIDLGVQVAPETFVAKIEEHQPDIVGFSAFLTTTMPMFKANINALQKAGMRDSVIVMVGGAPGHPGVRRRGRCRRLRGRRLRRASSGPRTCSRQAREGAAAWAPPLQETRIRSASKEVVIGGMHRFCIIGERINPTGRRIFQEQLRAGDLSAIERDVKAQVEGGADVLDVNMGVPLTDEAELLAKAVTMIQELTDLPLCIDSSVVEALEAGLSAYQGRALVNSITAEDERMEQILPLVKKYDAAVIALPNDVDEIPMEPDKRLRAGRQDRARSPRPSTASRSRTSSSTRWRCRSAPTTNGLATLETMRRIRDNYGLNMTCGCSNVSFGMPGRHELNGTFLSMAMTAGLTSAIMDARTPVGGLGRQGDRPAARPRRVGDGVDLPAPGSRRRPSERRDRRSAGGRRELATSLGGHRPRGPAGPARARRSRPHDGTGRVQLSFTVARRAGPRRARPARGQRLRLRVVERHRDRLHLRRSRHLPQVQGAARPADAGLAPRPSYLLRRPSCGAGWRLACLATATQDLKVEVPPLTTRPKAATVGVGRQVILRPAVQKRYVELADPTLPDQRTDLARLTDAIDDLELHRRPATCCGGCRRCCARPTSR